VAVVWVSRLVNPHVSGQSRRQPRRLAPQHRQSDELTEGSSTMTTSQSIAPVTLGVAGAG
jgi:hypothetical protein